MGTVGVGLLSVAMSVAEGVGVVRGALSVGNSDVGMIVGALTGAHPTERIMQMMNTASSLRIIVPLTHAHSGTFILSQEVLSKCINFVFALPGLRPPSPNA